MIADEALRDRLRVLLLARVLIVSVCLAGLGSLFLVRDDLSAGMIHDAAFWVIALAYVGTLISALVVHVVPRPRLLAYLQILFDVVLLSACLHAVKGTGGPLALLYVLPVANAAGLLLMGGAFTAAFLASVAHGAMMVSGQGGFEASSLANTWLPLTLNTGALLFVAAVVGALARRLGRVEEELATRERDMARLESLHRTLANGLECGVVVTDREGRVRSANPAVQRILGMPLANILGREVSWLVPLLDTASEMAADRGHVACERRMPDGSTRHLRIGRSLLADPFSNAIGELFVVQDVTRLEELEERLADEEQAGLEIGTGEDDLADQESSSDGPGAEDGLIGDCPAMRDVVRLTEKVSVADATVLITGESGTGKELVARAIHRRSPRSSGPFLAVNCGAIPETLIESELFGHVRGAFTGAITDRPGLFRRAHGGTIFLDEIGELSPALQVRLLRVLQDHMVMPVGGTKSIEVDVRVLAATNRNLEELVRQGVYREDLFYRLAVISIELPPLRERGGDLEHLIGHFVRQAAERHGRPIQGLSARAMRCLLRHAYPGNVRELENVIEHAITLVEGDIVREQDLPDSVRGHASVEPMAEPIVRATAIGMLDDGAPRDDLSSWPSLISESFPPNAASYPAFGAATSAPRILLPIDEGEGASLDDQLARREKEMILAALDRAAGVKKKAARLLGINYRSFRHRLQKYGLERGDSPAPRGFPPDSDY